MAGAKFDPRLFFQQADNVALHVPAAELFGLLRRSLDLPAQWAALARRSSGAHEVVPASGSVSGTDLDDVLFVRVTPIEVAFEEVGLVTARLLIDLNRQDEAKRILKGIVSTSKSKDTKSLAKSLLESI